MRSADRPAPMAPRLLAAVATGGALGATARWLTSRGVEALGWVDNSSGWPWATLIVNVFGCVLIGLAARRITRDTVSWAFVVTGVLGGFTTFSAFAVELNNLADADRLLMAFGYGAVTLVAGVGATVVAGRAIEVGE